MIGEKTLTARFMSSKFKGVARAGLFQTGNPGNLKTRCL